MSISSDEWVPGSRCKAANRTITQNDTSQTQRNKRSTSTGFNLQLVENGLLNSLRNLCPQTYINTVLIVTQPQSFRSDVTFQKDLGDPVKDFIANTNQVFVLLALILLEFNKIGNW